MYWVLDDNGRIVSLVNSVIEAGDNVRPYDGWNEIGKDYTAEEPLESIMARFLQRAGMEFAARRDAITWTQHEAGLYGYDRKSEDITNFLAAMKRAEIGLETGYNVYVGEGAKQFLPHTYEMFKTVLQQSAAEQIAAYQWYAEKKTEILAAKTKAELDLIFTEAANDTE
ncbi:hypothetical protein [Phascolarctobacterium faecium]|uniref:hypothetical protein n=1 Tax=Phascolarctobacterium faecium TaxID=33025 RepID=UPI003FEFB570